MDMLLRHPFANSTSFDPWPKRFAPSLSQSGREATERLQRAGYDVLAGGCFLVVKVLRGRGSYTPWN